LYALQRSLQRNFYEFDLRGRDNLQTIAGAGVQIQLRGTKPESHQFSVDITFDGLTMHKNDCYENEPIYIQTKNDRRPVEIVIGKVERDVVHGYLSAPSAPESKP